MTLQVEEVDKIADLARLELSEGERESFREQLSGILEYVGKLAEVDVEGVEPMSHAVPVRSVLREDEAEACPKEVRAGVVGAFPDSEDEMLRVRGVFS